MSYFKLTTPAGLPFWLPEANNISPTLGSWVRALAITYPDPTQQLTQLLDFLANPDHILSVQRQPLHKLVDPQPVQPLAISFKSETSPTIHLAYSSSSVSPTDSHPQTPSPYLGLAILLRNTTTDELFWAFPATEQFSLSSVLKDETSSLPSPQLPSILIHDIMVSTFPIALSLINNETRLRTEPDHISVSTKALHAFLADTHLSHLNLPTNTFLTIRIYYSLSELPGAATSYTLKFEINIHEPSLGSDPFFLIFTFHTHATLKAVDTLFLESLTLTLIAYHQLQVFRTAYQPLCAFKTNSIRISMPNPTWLLHSTPTDGTLFWTHSSPSPDGSSRLLLNLTLPSHPEPLRQFVNTPTAQNNSPPHQLTPEILQQLTTHANQIQLQHLSC